ncbi:hypothetical protein [Streptomyces sparsus]
MRTSATECETDLVDLSLCGLQEAMAVRHPLVVTSLDALMESLLERSAAQDNSGSGSPHFATGCSGTPV